MTDAVRADHVMPDSLRRVAAIFVGIGLASLLRVVAVAIGADGFQRNELGGLLSLYAGIGLFCGHRHSAFLTKLMSALFVLSGGIAVVALTVLGIVYVARGGTQFPLDADDVVKLVGFVPLGFAFAWAFRVVSVPKSVAYLDGLQQDRRRFAIRIEDILVATLVVALSLALSAPSR